MMRAPSTLDAGQGLLRSRFIGLLRPSVDAHRALAEGFVSCIGVPQVSSADGRPNCPSDWSIALEIGPLAVISGKDASIAIGSHGVVIGEVFRKDDGSRVRRFTPEEAGRFVATDFAELIDRFWGPYIAILHDPVSARTRILRAPLGELPCLMVPVGDALAFASDVGLMGDFGLYDPAVDWSELALQLARKDRVGTRTCLWSVRELEGGTMEVFGPSGSQTFRKWSPLQAIEPDRIETAEEASALVSRSARMCIASRSARLQRAVLMLSGGVDSSIIAAALVEAGVHVEALTLVTRDPLGDERDYARAVCDRLGIALHERERDVAEIDVMWSSAAGLPRPAGRFMWQESLRHALALAQTTHADAIFNGGGGDQVFCSLHSSNPVADALKAFGPGKTAWTMAHVMSEITQVPIIALLRDGVRRAWLGKRTAGATCDTSLLTGRFDHLEETPTVDRSARFLPGQEAHSRLIAAGQSYVETLDPRSLPAIVAPLLSQPLVEACLNIPSWLWFDGGLNRFPARLAFASELPENVIFRRSKGTPDSFTAEIFETWRAQIREVLADGELARQGVIDRAAVLEVLDDPRPPRDNRFRRVLQFAEAEAWAASWAAS